jgi:Arc/MetJ-type ribon-helix-helix transcriptional regulator
MTIHLPPSLEGSILAVVHSGRYASLDDAMSAAASLLLERLQHEQAQAPTRAASQDGTAPTHKPVWERILERTASIPDEEWDRLPTDLAEQHDHYLYGIPKRPTA